MKRITGLILALSTVLALNACGSDAELSVVDAQGTSSVEPFKVGTFEIDGAPTVGVVLRDALIIDVAAANTALETDPTYAHIDAPTDMLALIERYEDGLKSRIYQIVNNVVGNDLLGADYVHSVEDVTILAPILYPSKIMNAASSMYCNMFRALDLSLSHRSYCTVCFSSIALLSFSRSKLLLVQPSTGRAFLLPA